MDQAQKRQARQLRNCPKSIGEAEVGSKLYKDAFDRLGVSTRDAGGNLKSTEQIMMEVADGLKNTADPAIRVKTAFDLMGRSGTAMLQFMAKGSGNMKEFGDKAKQLGLIVQNDQVKALQDASGAMEEMGRTFQSFLASAAKPITAVIKGMSAVLKTLTGFVREWHSNWCGICSNIVVGHQTQDVEWCTCSGWCSQGTRSCSRCHRQINETVWSGNEGSGIW